MKHFLAIALVAAAIGCASESTPANTTAQTAGPTTKAETESEVVALDVFFSFFADDDDGFERSLAMIASRWRDGYAIMLLELATFLPRQRAEPIFTLLRQRSAVDAKSPDDLFQWVWKLAPPEHPEYARFKMVLYGQIDPRFTSYFDDYTDGALIRLDEVRWGGVKRDGIPPLKNPAMLAANEASYLAEGDVVFGLEINGDARAYPKRILAWHEMFKDTIGGESINGVYCTLCGSMIVYRTTHDGTHYELGTSGFLYRSNKLMYDHATESMWSTIRGAPVIGPLVGKGIALETLSVVTTTWGEWRARHPKTSVLSLETGHQRDYGEGVAYREYFATDELMFTIPKLDNRLKNKAEILALRFGGTDAKPTAIAAAFLANNPIYQSNLGDVSYVIITDTSGANRVYRAAGTRWKSYRDGRLVDDRGGLWTVAESSLTGPDGETRSRLPAHRAFWFGWYAAHPNTVLIQ